MTWRLTSTPLLGVEQLPLVEHDDERAAGGVDPLGQALVLGGDPDGGVDDEQGDVGAVDRLQGPDERVVLGALVDLRPAAHPGGVDEPDGPVLGLHHRVDGVAGGARQVVDHRPLLADQAVEERRLADVGPADDGDRRRCRRRSSSASEVVAPRRRASSARLREAGDELVEEVAGPPAVQRRHRQGLAETERRAGPRSAPRGRCRRPCWRRAGPGSGARRTTSAARASSSVTPVTASTTNSTASASAMARSACSVTLSSRLSPPASHPPVSTRVNRRPPHSASTSLRSRVTPGLLLDDRLPPPDDAVEQGRLADVGAADDGDDGQGHG